MSAERFKKRLPVPYTDWLPEALKRNLGKWVDRKFHGYGIIEHVSATGERIFTVKVGTPPNFRVSVDTLKKFVEIADTYGIGALRITRNGNVEFMGHEVVSSEKTAEGYLRIVVRRLK